MAIHYGREAELPGADRGAQEISMLTLHLLQSALVLVNTPLFWSNVALHGTFQLDLDQRIDYERGTATAPEPTQEPR